MRQRRPSKMRFRFFPLFLLIGIFGMGWVVMFLWNNVLAGLLPVPLITYWKAVGLLALCRILFGNLGSHQGRRWGNRPGIPGPHTDAISWRNKWRSMTQEERQKFREEMINRRRNRFNR